MGHNRKRLRKEVKAAIAKIAKARTPRGRNLLFFGDEKLGQKEIGIREA